MGNFSKKFLALLLTLCMLVGIMPMSAVAAGASAEVIGQQLMLGDDLCMHLYATVEGDLTNTVATIQVSGVTAKTYNLAGMTSLEDGSYDLSVNLGAPQMADEIKLIITDGQEEILNKSYSIQNYAHYLLENNYTAETKALAKEMLNYGAKAQLYFDHNTDNLANAGYEMETEATIAAEVPAVAVTDNLAGISYHGSSMVFESKIAVRYYFYALNGVDGYTFTVDGKNYTPVSKNGYYYIEVSGINPDQMETRQAVSVTKDGGSLSLSYSPMDYITRMYNKASSSDTLKAMLLAANGYFKAAEVFTGVAENKTGSLTLGYRYGTDGLIQVNTNLPATTPCANFTTGDNGCSIDESANQYQQAGWIGMDNVDGTIVLTFHFNGKFESGHTYVLPKGAVFGFTDGSKYALDKDYTFTFDGSGWSMEAKEPAVTLSYRYGTADLIQFNTNLPSDTPCVNFTASDNGCVLDQSGNKYQQVGWIGMDNVDGTIVLTFHFNSAFTAGQNYTLAAGSLFGFTDGSKYQLDSNVNLYWNGSDWTAEAPTVSFTYRYGTANLIQVNTDLPSDTPCVNFTASDNGCILDQSANQYQQVGWIGMDNVDGTIVLTFHFNSDFAAGQNYTLAAGSVFGFTNGNLYYLNGDYTFNYDGASWTADVPEEEPDVTEPEETEPEVTEPELASVDFGYRYGTNNLIQVNTDLPATTPISNFLAGDNGCNLLQSGDQQVGWIGMDNVDGTIVLTFHFNAAFAAGQCYTLAAGSVFGFTDGNKYQLIRDYTFTFDGSSWSVNEPATEEKTVELSYRYGAGNLIQYNTNLPATTPLADFLASDNGCNLLQSGDQQVGWISMADAEGTIVLTFNFNASFTAGQSYTLAAGSVFGFTDGNTYTLPADVTLYWDGAAWIDQEPTKEITLSYRYGAGNLIQFNTNLPASTTLKDFLASDNGCQITQGGDQQVGYVSMLNADGTIVLTFNFNAAFTVGQSYTLAAGSVFAFADGTSYTLDKDYAFYWDGSAWGTEPLILLGYRYGAANLIQVNTNLPATTPIANFLAGDNGCNLLQSGDQAVGWIGMANADGTIVLTFNFNAAFAVGQSYSLAAGSVFGFTDGSSYILPFSVTLYWDGTAWSTTAPEPEIPADVLDESNFTGGKDFISFADLPVDSGSMEKIEEYKGLGFNTSLLAEDHTGAKGPDELYTATMDTANAPASSLGFQYRYGTSTLIQVNTNLPAATPIANFLASDNGCNLLQSGDQQVGWIGMANAEGIIVLTFNFNVAFTAGQSYTLAAGSVFGFTDGNTYTLDSDYTFTFDGTNWSVEASTLRFSLSAASAKYIQLKTNVPTGLTYGDFLLGDTAKGNVILETTDGAQSVAWFSYSELSGAVYLTFNFTGFNKPGTQYILKAGTTLNAGEKTYTTDRDYIITVENDYLQALENLDAAGLNVWIRNYHNTADYFTEDLTAALLLYKDVIDGFYMMDEAFQNNELLTSAGQEANATDFDSMLVVRDWFNTNFGDKYYHSNHVPISSYDHYTDANGNVCTEISAQYYERFLRLYKTNFNDQLSNASGTSIGFDNYPFIHAQGTYKYGILNMQSKFESGIQSYYLLNCLIAANVAGQDDFGLCIQTFEASDLTYDVTRDIASAAEVSLQLYTGMAMGADLFEYFAYNSNGEFNTIMNQDGSKRIYDIVKEGNGALCFSDVINTFTWNGIVTSTGSVNSHNTEGFTLVENYILTNISNGVLDSYASTDDAIIGCFTKGDLNGYMVVNFNDPAAVTGNNTVNLTFADCTRARVYTCVDGVLTSELIDLTNGACTVTLEPGSGCFVIPA